jgi:hypothetical protein
MRTRRSDSPKVVIVGPCASGKSSLAAALRDRGIDARVVAQEHSIIRDLWHRQDPDLLIALDVDLETLRARRSPTWLASVYESQRARLAPAFMAADLVLDTSPLALDAVIATVLAWLEGKVADSGGDEGGGGAAIS